MCLFVYEQTLLTTNTIGTSIELPKDVKLYKDQINDRTLLKPFGYKFITIIHHMIAISSLSEDFWYQRSTWKHNLLCMKAIVVESQFEIKYK